MVKQQNMAIRYFSIQLDLHIKLKEKEIKNILRMNTLEFNVVIGNRSNFKN